MSAETINQAEAEAAPAETEAKAAVAATPKEDSQPAPKQASEGDKAPSNPLDAYEFKTPEGRDAYAPELLVAFKDVAKKHGLDTKAAQGVLDDMAPAIVQRFQEATAKQIADWSKQVANDPEIGGNNLPETKRLAGVFMDKFADAPLREWLNQGAGNNPHLVKMMRKAGSHFVQDTVVTGAPPKAAPKSTADVLFGDSTSK